jgi:FKBP-type peptidyl-prolyl cis-trans isomerase FklB
MSRKSDARPGSNEEMVSYGLGWQFGRHLLGHQFDGFDLEMAFAGIKDCLDDKESPITDQQVENAFRVIASRVESEQRKQAQQLAGKSEEFLAENARRDEVSVTHSGLQYEVIENGDGRRPSALESVVVHYHGTLFNGEVFDSSVERGEPIEFSIQNVIPGWTEVLQLMPKGSRWRTFIPAELAYGEKGSPPKIPGNCALVFEIELIDIV